MSTTFANTINGNPIYAARAESDKNGDRIDTTYAKLSDIPPGVTVDQTYNSSSTNAQSGTAVAEAVSDALSTINQVPASTSSDEDKVLTVDSNGDPVWAASQGAPQVQANWTESDTTSPAYIQNKPTIPAAVTVDQTYNASSTNPQSGTAVAGAIASVNQVPASTASDEDKVLTVNSSGNPVWAPAQGGAQVQSDWTESDTTDPAYIQNKPTTKSISAGSGISITESSNSVVISATGGGSGTVDQTYNASSTNAQSGTAVAGALATVNQVPASTASDEDKVLTVNSSGTPVWAAAQGGTQVQSDWSESDTTDPSYIQNKPAEKSLVAGSNISITDVANNVTISATIPAQVNSDWTASSGVAEILNKPDLVDIVAGPGIVVDNPDGNTLRVSMATDYETVLWSGSSTGQTPTFALSEAYSNFEYIRITAVEDYGFVGSITVRTENITTDNRFSLPIYVVNSGFTRGVGMRSIYFHPTSTTAFDSQCGGFDFVNGYSVNDKTHVKTIIGIHRIAGGN